MFISKQKYEENLKNKKITFISFKNILILQIYIKFFWLVKKKKKKNFRGVFRHLKYRGRPWAIRKLSYGCFCNMITRISTKLEITFYSVTAFGGKYWKARVLVWGNEIYFFALLLFRPQFLNIEFRICDFSANIFRIKCFFFFRFSDRFRGLVFLNGSEGFERWN